MRYGYVIVYVKEVDRISHRAENILERFSFERFSIITFFVAPLAPGCGRFLVIFTYIEGV